MSYKTGKDKVSRYENGTYRLWYGFLNWRPFLVVGMRVFEFLFREVVGSPLLVGGRDGLW